MSTDDIEKLHHEMKFTARMNINYHTHAANVYGWMSNASNFLAIVFSSAALATINNIIPSAEYSKYVTSGLALIVTLSSAFVLVYNVAQKQHTHGMIRSEWLKIYGRLEEAGLNDKPKETMEKLQADIHLLHASEPPPRQSWLERAYAETVKNLGLSPLPAA